LITQYTSFSVSVVTAADAGNTMCPGGRLNKLALVGGIGPGDGNMIVHGKWKLKDKDLTFTFENEIFVYQILLIEKDRLVLRRER
jgi:hypothetical protein